MIAIVPARVALPGRRTQTELPNALLTRIIRRVVTAVPGHSAAW